MFKFFAIFLNNPEHETFKINTFKDLQRKFKELLEDKQYDFVVSLFIESKYGDYRHEHRLCLYNHEFDKTFYFKQCKETKLHYKTIMWYRNKLIKGHNQSEKVFYS